MFTLLIICMYVAKQGSQQEEQSFFTKSNIQEKLKYKCLV